MPKQDFIQPTLSSTLLWPYTAGGLLLYDDMEGVLEWSGSGTGVYTMEQSHDHAYQGDYSLLLKTRAAAAANDFLEATRKVGLTPRKKLLLSFYFYPYSSTNIKNIAVNFGHYDGSSYIHGELRYSYSSLLWQYLKSNGLYANVTGSGQKLFAEAWHSFSLNIDFVNSQYTQMVSDGLIIDMTSLDDYGLRSAASAIYEHLYITFRIETVGANQISTYFDLVKVGIV